MAKKSILVAVAALAILGSATWIYVQMRGGQPSIQLDPYRALGQVAAEETGRLLSHKGRVVVVADATPSGADPVEEAKLKAFSGSLNRDGVSIEAIERFSLPPSARMFGNIVPREWFLNVLKVHPEAAALVLFAEFPALEQSDKDLLKQRGVRIVLISGDRLGSKRLTDAGLVQLAIVPRYDSPLQASKQPQGTRDCFDRYYMVLAQGKTAKGP